MASEARTTLQPPQTELLYLIQRYLTLGPCSRAAELLKDEIDKNKLMPQRVDAFGNVHDRSFAEYDNLLQHLLPTDTLGRICTRIRPLIDKVIPTSLPNVPESLLGTGSQSLFRNEQSFSLRQKRCLSRSYVARFHGKSVLPSKHSTCNTQWLLSGQPFSGPVGEERFVDERLLGKVDLHCRILGHLASIFCVAFDRSGEYIITGADDNLIKVWSAHDGLLRFTFRGSAGEITDLSVSHENTLLAAGSVDKMVRVWCLRSGALLQVFHSHSAQVTQIHFVPFVDGDDRYLVSTSNDCSVCFWKWNAVSNEFDERPYQFQERETVGAQMICSCYSPGGRFVATGCTDHYVRVYKIGKYGPERVLETSAHSDRLDSLCWAHSGLRFCTGSKDGIAKIWWYERQKWKNVSLCMSDVKPKDSECTTQVTSNVAKNNKMKVTMVAWSGDDKWVITAASDFHFRIWDSKTGDFVRFLQGHKDEAFVLDSHPSNPRILLSAGHDGNVILWNLDNGSIIKKHFNAIEGSGHGALFDACFSPENGLRVVAVDSHGHLTILGVNSNDKIKKVPEEQFFHTDYRPMISDGRGYVLDEQTQLAPHLMPPPFLVNGNGEPHPPELQRFVPGKERISKAQLAPTTIRRTGESANVEVISPSPSRNGDNTSSTSDPSTNCEPMPLCAWINGRSIVRPLLPSVLSNIISRLEALGSQEDSIYDKEYSRNPLPEIVPITLEQKDTSKVTRRGRKRQTASAHVYETRTNPRQSEAYNSDEYVDPDNLSDQSSSTSNQSSSSESDSDSDYSGYNDTPKLRRRTIRTRRAGSPENEQDEDEEEEDEESENEPSTSTERRPSPGRPRGARANHSKTTASPRKRGPKRIHEYLVSFPDWMTNTALRRFPYFPQVGDEVTYFKQGHEWYLRAVEDNNTYRLNSKYQPPVELDTQENMIIDKVNFVIHPYRLCQLRLSQLHRRTNERTGESFNIRFHDFDGVPDWIVLKEHVDDSLNLKWKAGDRMKAVIDGQWWFGRVDKREPRILWQCMVVKWDNGEEEKMNPWDCEKCTENEPPSGRHSLAATDDDMRRLAHYHPKPHEWPSGGRDGECGRLFVALEQLSVLDPIASLFVNPVDLSLYPNYSLTVEYPIDLATIRERLENEWYRRLKAVEFDVLRIVQNAQKFNELDSDVVRNARILCVTLLRFIRDSSLTEILDLYGEIEQLSDNELSKEIKRMTEDEESRLNKRPKKESKDPVWKADCEHVINRLMQMPEAEPFLNRDHPELTEIFDTALDLTTISETLASNRYNSPEAFENDVLCLLQNCRSVATSKRHRIYQSALRLHNAFVEMIEPLIERLNRIEREKTARNSASTGRLRQKKEKHAYNTRSNFSHPVPQARPNVVYSSSTPDHHRTRTRSSRQPSPFESLPSEFNTESPTNGHSPSTSVDQSPCYSSPSRVRRATAVAAAAAIKMENESDEEERIERKKRKATSLVIKRSATRRRVESLSDDEPSTSNPPVRKVVSERINGTQIGQNGRKNKRVNTRYGGKRHVVYKESSDESESENIKSKYSMSSRGRTIKMKRFDD